MEEALDPRRIEELEALIGPELGEIFASLERSIGAAVEEADTAVAAGDLPGAAYAAHRCRNDALMVGASKLKEALSALERATRRHELEQARSAMARVRELWPPTRDEILRRSSAAD